MTGVSTGALIAPLAFLGPDYDAALREVYTDVDAGRIYRARGLSAALFDDAMADTTPLVGADRQVRRPEDARRDRRGIPQGRLLLIGTTDLDAQRPVIWNIGAIASSGHPGALDLCRRSCCASAAIPGAFQPVLIDVELDGEKYQELHVDGGAIAQLFLYPPSLDLGRIGIKRERRAWVIRNARLDPDYAESRAPHHRRSPAGRSAPCWRRAASNDVLRDLFRDPARWRGLQSRLYRPGFHAPEKKGEFDQAFMRALYDYGYRQARDGQEWHKMPPGLQGGKGRRAAADSVGRFAEGRRPPHTFGCADARHELAGQPTEKTAQDQVGCDEGRRPVSHACRCLRSSRVFSPPPASTIRPPPPTPANGCIRL